MTTIDQAENTASIAADVLFAGPDPFKGLVDRDSLVRNLREATLRKLVLEDSDILEEEEFMACIEASKK